MADGLLNKKIGFIIQARMGSTRLPEKILMSLPPESKKCLLDYILESLNKSGFNHSIFIATSISSNNNPLEIYCNKNKITCYRGSENDVLSRFIHINKMNEFDYVVRFTADNPFIDIDLLDKSISQHIESEADYTTTTGLPIGMNFEIVNATALQSLENKDLSVSEREHVTLHFKNSNKYKLNTFVPITKDLSKVRLTVDYPSDYLVVSTIISIAEKIKSSPSLKLIEYCLVEYPWIFKVNQGNIQKTTYKNLKDEIEVAKPILDTYGFDKLISFINRYEEI